MSEHLLIAGTGRAGTSVLVQFLHQIGLETELTALNGKPQWDDFAKAGVETAPSIDGRYPYVMKSPWAYQFLRQILGAGGVSFRAAVLPMRNLTGAAASRVIVELAHLHRTEDISDRGDVTWSERGLVPGGVVYSLEPLDEERILAVAFYRTVEILIEYNIPIFFLEFPRFTTDEQYFFEKISELLPSELSRGDFKQAFDLVIDPSAVRVEAEMGLPSASVGFASSRLVQLDNASLKRELLSARGTIATLYDQRRSDAMILEELKARMSELQQHMDDLSAKHHIAVVALNAKAVED